jgi:hypothetical protein
VPETDPGRFVLKIDSTEYTNGGAGFGDGGTTGFVPLLAGLHTVSEIAAAGTDLAGYATSISCDNGASGAGTSLGVTLTLGQQVTCTIRNIKSSLVTSSSLCTFDVDGAAGNQFRLVYTPDPAKPQAFKLNASNPGQYYYNVFYSAPAGTTPDNPVTLTLNIPYPFVTQGAQPVHIYDGATTTFTTQNGQTCILPGTGLGSLPDDTAGIVLTSHTPQAFGGDAQVTVLLTQPGAYYVNIHLDYGLKGTNNYAQGANANAIDFDSLALRIPNNQPYDFSASDGTTTWDPTVYSLNVFKKNPGVGGNTHLVFRDRTGAIAGLEPMAGGLPLEIFQGTKKLGATVTDPDGWYMWNYKYTGKPVTFTVKLRLANGTWQSKSITMKSNGFVVVDFAQEQ